MIDASKGFLKDGPKNRLRAQDIHLIVDAFTRQLELPRYSRMVPLAEIEANDFNLNLPRYIDSSEPEDLQDIDAHLRGGIPNRDVDALDRYWQVFPCVRTAVFEEANRPGYAVLKVPVSEVKAAIFEHPEFTTFIQGVTRLFENWNQLNAPVLEGIAIGGKPKPLIDTLSESLLDTFRQARLLDPYDVYQHLLDYWAETMQDDAYLLVQEGWNAILGGKSNTDLIPQPLIVARYFAKEHEYIEKLEANRDAITRQMEELDEEHGGEDGLLAEAKTDTGKLTRASVRARFADVSEEVEADEGRHQLLDCLALIEKESEASKQAKDAQRALEIRVTATYAKLAEDAVKTLVVDDKWIATIRASVESELDRVSQTLTRRIRELAERYAHPLPQLTAEIATLTDRVDDHLRRMRVASK